MNKKQANTILRMIEKAYRRGWQQGYTACSFNPHVAEGQIHKWRFDKSLNKHIPAPENESFYIAKESFGTVLDRLRYESHKDDELELYYKIEMILERKDK